MDEPGAMDCRLALLCKRLGNLRTEVDAPPRERVISEAMLDECQRTVFGKLYSGGNINYQAFLTTMKRAWKVDSVSFAQREADILSFTFNSEQQAEQQKEKGKGIMDIEEPEQQLLSAVKPSSWSNNREGADLVKEKLDRVFCSLDWRLMFPEAEAFALPAVGSDHSPLLLVSSAETDPVCDLCRDKVESVEHTLLLCPWAAKVWNYPEINLPSLDRIANLLWQIWKERNNFVFRGTKPEVWQAPKAGSFKINVDGSLCEGSMEGAVACVVRDSSGSLIDGFTKLVRAESVLQLETLGVLEALKYLKEKKVGEALVETDNQSVVNCLTKEEEMNWQARADLFECKSLMQQLPLVGLTYCPRSANAIANWAARQQRMKTLPPR